MRIQWNSVLERSESPTWDGEDHVSAYDNMLYTIFQRPRESGTSGLVIALTSFASGEGVTYVTRTLVDALGRSDENSVAHINARFLRGLYEPTSQSLRASLECSSRELKSAREVDSVRSIIKPKRRGRWEGSWQYRRDCIELLRKEFDYTIIDCPSLRESGDVLSMAPFVDGVILVVQANRTRAEQVRQAEQNIETAQGKLLGHIFNKRTYDVPGWLYHRL